MFLCRSLVYNVCMFYVLAVDVQAMAQGAKVVPRRARFGRLLPDANVQFDKAESSSLNLVGKAKG